MYICNLLDSIRRLPNKNVILIYFHLQNSLSYESVLKNEGSQQQIEISTLKELCYETITIYDSSNIGNR